MKSSSFAREYDLKYGYGTGNVVTALEIEQALTLGKAMSKLPTYDMHTTKTLGIDAGFGTSKFAHVISEHVDGRARIIHSAEYDRPQHEAMLSVAINLIIGHGIDKVYVDAANVSFIKSLKQRFINTDIVDYEHDPFVMSSSRRIVPVSFGSGNGTKMISHLKFLFGNNLIGIDPDNHPNLISQIRTAKTVENGNLDKTRSGTTFDLFDAFRLSLIRYTEDGVEVIKRK
jgi:hypothetical protein